MGKHQDRRLTFWQNFIAGGIAGVGSRTFTSPLDVVKNYLPGRFEAAHWFHWNLQERVQPGGSEGILEG